ncbi:MAG: DNA gyrase C-terminal beta-propeller domain-containing protein, partial [Candidatus Promineifilaceae bacterium]
RRLAALERQRIASEYQNVTDQITKYRSLLADKNQILGRIRAELLELKDTFGDERRSEIIPGESEFDIEDLVKDEDVLISITGRGYIKRTPTSAYRVQGRGGKGLIGMTTRDEDSLENLFASGSKSPILFFTDKGKVYVLKTYRIPEAGRTSRGTSVMNLLPLEQNEKVTASLPVTNFDDADYLILVTKNGRIKRIALSAFAKVRSTGIIAISLDDDDELRWVKMTTGEQDVVLVSKNGQGIRFSETDVRPMGRTAGGVMAMKLTKNDHLAGAGVSDSEDNDVLIITRSGYGKRTAITDFRRQNRYGSGVRAMVFKNKGDEIIGGRVVTQDDELTCISDNGIILRIAADSISRQGRSTQGVRVMDIRDDDSVASIAVISEGKFTGNDSSESAETEAEAETETEAAPDPTEAAPEAAPESAVPAVAAVLEAS